MFGRKSWIKGTATVVSYQVISTSGGDAGVVRSFIRAQVVAQGEGIEPTSTELAGRISHARLPLPDGYVFDVRIKRSDPTQIKLEEDNRKVIEELRAKRAAAEQAGRTKADELAATMRGESSPAADGG